VPRLDGVCAHSLLCLHLAPNRPCILSDGTRGWGIMGCGGNADAALAKLEAISGSDSMVRAIS
jgi:hypothetical protein